MYGSMYVCIYCTFPLSAKKCSNDPNTLTHRYSNLHTQGLCIFHTTQNVKEKENLKTKICLKWRHRRIEKMFLKTLELWMWWIGPCPPLESYQNVFIVQLKRWPVLLSWRDGNRSRTRRGRFVNHFVNCTPTFLFVLRDKRERYVYFLFVLIDTRRPNGSLGTWKKL